jgi:hypothetical protein
VQRVVAYPDAPWHSPRGGAVQLRRSLCGRCSLNSQQNSSNSRCWASMLRAGGTC